MQRPRNQLLAGTAGALDEHGAVAVGDLRQQVEELAHSRTAPDDVGEGVRSLQLLAQLFDQAEVAKRLDAANRVAVGVLEGRRRDADGNPPTVGVEDVDGLVHDRPPGPQRLLQGTLALADARPEDVAAWPPNGLIVRHPRNLLGGAVERRDPPILIDGEDPVGDGIEDRRRSAFLGCLSHLSLTSLARTASVQQGDSPLLV